MKMEHKGVKLTKVQDADYDNSAVYEWEGYTIERDASCLSGGVKYWYCDLFKNGQFRTLKGVKKAIQTYLEKGRKLTPWELTLCEEE